MLRDPGGRERPEEFVEFALAIKVRGPRLESEDIGCDAIPGANPKSEEQDSDDQPTESDSSGGGTD